MWHHPFASARSSRAVQAAALLSLSVVATLPVAAAGYTVRTLPLPFLGRQAGADALSPVGSAVGSYFARLSGLQCTQTENGCFPISYAIRPAVWTGTSVRQIRCLPTSLDPATVPCSAYDINRSGVMVGQSYSGSSSLNGRAVRWSSPTATPTDLTASLTSLGLSVRSSEAVAVNDAGAILGSVFISNVSPEQPFIWSGGSARLLPLPANLSVRVLLVSGLNNSGMAVATARGVNGVASAVAGLLWPSLGQPIVVPGFETAGVSEAGHVVGIMDGAATLWFQGNMQRLATDAGYSSVGLAVNRQGVVVGAYAPFASFDSRAVMWGPSGRQDLNTLAKPPSGMVFTKAVDINDAGQILVGMRDSGDREGAAILTPRP